MKEIFGPHTRRLLAFLTDLWRLTPEEINTVTRAWKEANNLNRAEAWAQLNRAAARDERHRIMAAASVARRQAMDVADLSHRADWAFWAAAWDAAAAIAADDGRSRHYEVLAAPVMTVLPQVLRGRRSVQIPAQRPGRQAGARRDAARRGRTRAGYQRQHSPQEAAARDAEAQ